MKTRTSAVAAGLIFFEADATGSGSNMAALSYTKVNGIIYLFTNDEKGRGTQVWRIER